MTKADKEAAADKGYIPQRHIMREMPKQWTDRYSEEDKKNIEKVIKWLNKNEKPLLYLANAASQNKGLTTSLLNGKYDGRVAEQLKKLTSVIRNLDERKNDLYATPFIETSVSRHVFTGCAQARLTRRFSIVACAVGTGKTRALKAFTRDNENTWMIESHAGMNVKTLVNKLFATLNIPNRSAKGYVSTHDRIDQIIEYVSDIEGGIIIIDEAETINAKALETIRRISDIGEIGVVLAGTPILHQLIKPVGGQFDQIRSRAIFFPSPIFHITRDDARAIIKVCFHDRGEIYDEEGELIEELFETFWNLTKGSLRVLVEGLIPAIKRYGIPQKNIVNSNVVLAVAKQVLYLTPERQH